jgi:hypothetical protein
MLGAQNIMNKNDGAEHKVREIDKNCWEKFKWSWLDKDVTLTINGQSVKYKIIQY